MRLVGSYKEKTFYAFVDYQPFEGINYYQIIMVTDDGVFKSNLVSERRTLPQLLIQIYPNPFEDELPDYRPDDECLLTLFDASGKFVLESRLRPDRFAKIVYPLHDLPPGTYSGHFKTGQRSKMVKVVKR